MARKDYQTTAGYALSDRPGAGEALRLTTFGEALVNVLASVVYAGVAMVLILFLGTLGWFAFKRSWLSDDAEWRLLQLSLAPWGVLLLKLFWDMWQTMRLTHADRRSYAQLLARGAGAEPVAKDYRLIPVHMPTLYDGVPVEDLIEFVEQLHIRGHTSRQWVDVYRFRSGRTCSWDDWKAMTGALAKAGILIGQEPRKKGRLLTTDPDEILARLRLTAYASRPEDF